MQINFVHAINANLGALAVALAVTSSPTGTAAVTTPTVEATAKCLSVSKFWRCRVTCTANPPGTPWNQGEQLVGEGEGPTEAAACQAAKFGAGSSYFEDFYQTLIFGGDMAPVQLVCPPDCDACFPDYKTVPCGG